MTWETLSSTYVIENAPWLTLRRDDVRLPNGNVIEGYWVVEQPPWANVVAITEHDEVVFVRQYRHAFGRYGLEIPGGYVDAGEAPLEAARREMLEETGYGGGSWTELFRLAPNPALQDNLVYCYAARGVRRVADPAQEATEDLEVVLRGVDDLRSLIADGTIHHALHIAPLLAAVHGWDAAKPG